MQIFESEDAEFKSFAKEIYNQLELEYPRFFKMDRLSKLAFLASEVLFGYLRKQDRFESDTAIVFSNRASSIDTDRRHQKTIEHRKTYFPSPAVFVYTLPNICIGEISIRNRLFSENSFFIFDHFNAAHLFHITNGLLEAQKATSVLCGWVEMDEDRYEAFLYVVGKQGPTAHEITEINRLYQIT